MALAAPDYERLTDIELAVRFAAKDPIAVRLVTTRNNQRLYRTAWSIVKNRAEAEEVVQETYLRALGAIAKFEGRSSLSTWLTRIAINEALTRKRSAQRRANALNEKSVLVMDEYREKLLGSPERRLSPEAELARKQLKILLESAVAKLPDNFRTVFVLREIEGLSVEEASEALDIPAETVRSRHLRARQKIQKMLDPEMKSAMGDTFPFAGADCEALTARVLARMGIAEEI
ncbi:MAG: RNA polymerase sigma factor [Rhizomicrobium sp.]